MLALTTSTPPLPSAVCSGESPERSWRLMHAKTRPPFQCQWYFFYKIILSLSSIFYRTGICSKFTSFGSPTTLPTCNWEIVKRIISCVELSVWVSVFNNLGCSKIAMLREFYLLGLLLCILLFNQIYYAARPPGTSQLIATIGRSCTHDFSIPL